MLTVLTWCWGSKYPPNYVRKVAAGFRRHLKEPHRFVVVTETPERFKDERFEAWQIPEADHHLLYAKGCFARLRMFDPTWPAAHGINADDRVVWVDLDVVVTGPLDGLFDRPEKVVIFSGANKVNPCPFNGSLLMLRAGSHPEVWSSFSVEASRLIRRHEFPDDQGWIWHKLPDAAGWRCGPDSGVYAFHKRKWPNGDDLPFGAKMVCFPGARDPSEYNHLGWVKANWRESDG